MRFAHWLLKVALVFGIVIGAHDLARAGDWRQYATAGNWTVVTNGIGCDTSVSFINGANVGIGIRGDGAAVLGVGLPSWDIPPGDYAAKLRVDSEEWRDGDFHVGNVPDQISAKIPDELLGKIAKGQKLHIRAGSFSGIFDLSGSREAIAQTIRCARQSGNPFAGDALPSEELENPFGATTKYDM